MADERVKLTRNIQGGTEIRVDRLVLADMGQAWMENELSTRGLLPGDFGEPRTVGRNVIIPIRKDPES